MLWSKRHFRRDAVFRKRYRCIIHKKEGIGHFLYGNHLPLCCFFIGIFRKKCRSKGIFLEKRRLRRVFRSSLLLFYEEGRKNRQDTAVVFRKVSQKFSGKARRQKKRHTGGQTGPDAAAWKRARSRRPAAPEPDTAIIKVILEKTEILRNGTCRNGRSMRACSARLFRQGRLRRLVFLREGAGTFRQGCAGAAFLRLPAAWAESAGDSGAFRKPRHGRKPECAKVRDRYPAGVW